MTNGRNIVARGLEYLALALAGLAACGLATIVGLIVTSVVMRKFLNAPLFFTEEVVGLIMSACLFLALPLVTLQAKHVQVSILSSFLNARSRSAARLLAVAAATIGVVCCVWLTLEAIPWMQFALRLNLKTETSRVLLWPWMASLPVSIGLTGLIFLWQLAGLVFAGNNKPAPVSERQ